MTRTSARSCVTTPRPFTVYTRRVIRGRSGACRSSRALTGHDPPARTGADREIVHSYPYRSACPSTVWADLIGHTTRDLSFAGYTNYFLWTQQPAFTATLRAKAEGGCRVRFLLGDPEGEVTRQREAVEDVALTVSTRIRITLGELEKLGPVEGWRHGPPPLRTRPRTSGSRCSASTTTRWSPRISHDWSGTIRRCCT
ncbi:hypothetical protein GCM10010211_35250 [Streptomyces albospinus]|uniref:DNA-binding protein n=1 Tax=Streptomyces albospinus TaxID=285515 RepID=A0ABQ2V4X8_9ACTN|nr:hypothetical protein GCM10010211_35250 [Streptomyces albospinus]